MISCKRRKSCDKYIFDYLGGIEIRHGSQSYEILIFGSIIDRNMVLRIVVLEYGVVQILLSAVSANFFIFERHIETKDAISNLCTRDFLVSCVLEHLRTLS